MARKKKRGALDLIGDVVMLPAKFAHDIGATAYYGSVENLEDLRRFNRKMKKKSMELDKSKYLLDINKYNLALKQFEQGKRDEQIKNAWEIVKSPKMPGYGGQSNEVRQAASDFIRNTILSRTRASQPSAHRSDVSAPELGRLRQGLVGEITGGWSGTPQAETRPRTGAALGQIVSPTTTIPEEFNLARITQTHGEFPAKTYEAPYGQMSGDFKFMLDSGIFDKKQIAQAVHSRMVRPPVTINQKDELSAMISLGKEFSGDQRVKNYYTAREFTGTIRRAYKQALTEDRLKGPADIAMAKAFQKLTDIMSSVREGEFLTTFKGQPFWNKFFGAVKAYTKGGLGFSEQDREELLRMALQMEANLQSLFGEAYDNMLTRVEALKLDPVSVMGNASKFIMTEEDKAKLPGQKNRFGDLTAEEIMEMRELQRKKRRGIK